MQRAAQAAADARERSRKKSVEELWSLSGLDITKLQAAEYAEAKLAESEPEKLRNLFIHLVEGRIEFWSDRLAQTRPAGSDSLEAGNQYSAWHGDLFCLKNWQPGLAEDKLRHLKHAEAVMVGHEQLLAWLKMKNARLRAELAGRQRN